MGSRSESWIVAGALTLLCVMVLPTVVGAQPSLTDSSLQLDTVVSGLSLPTTMAFLAPDDILVLQKNDGLVRRVVGGSIQSTVLDVAVNFFNERGLLGIAINTESPPGVFLYYTEVSDPDGDGQPDLNNGTPLGNRVYRYTWNSATAMLESPQLVLDLPVLNGPNHDGGIVLLGPTPTPVAGAQQSVSGDGSPLYVVIGDLNRSGQLQNFPAGPAPDDTGVILRVEQDGSAAPGNLFVPYCSTTTGQTCANGTGCPGGETCITEVARYYAYGVRNSFGLTLDPVTGHLWDTENGPELNDEVNLVASGFNSGWLPIMGLDSSDLDGGTGDLFNMPGAGLTYSDPEFTWISTIAPTAILFPVGSTLGSSYDDVALVGDSNNGQLYRFPLNAQRDAFDFSAFATLQDLEANSITERNLLRIGSGFASGFGGITDLKIGPDGAVYVVSFSNGAIYRITSKTPTPTPSSTETPTSTSTPTRTPTSTPTGTPTMTPTQTSTSTPTITPTSTPIPTATETPVCLLDVDDSGRPVDVATDLVYIARHLSGLDPVPQSFRDLDTNMTIPTDVTVIANCNAALGSLDVDGDLAVEVATDIVYIARHLLGLVAVPPSFRDLDPTIPDDSVIVANIDAACP